MFSNAVMLWPSPTFLADCVANAGEDKAQFFTLRSAKALAMTALDLLLQPKVMQRVKQEFNEAKLKDDKTRVGSEQLKLQFC